MTQGAKRRVPRGPELSVIIPTFNEVANVPEIVRRLRICLPSVAWEAIFVDDDSNDGTAGLVREPVVKTSKSDASSGSAAAASPLRALKACWPARHRSLP